MAALVGGFPWDWGKGPLEKRVVDDVALVVLAFNDPVAWVGFPLSRVGEDDGGLAALRGVYE